MNIKSLKELRRKLSRQRVNWEYFLVNEQDPDLLNIVNKQLRSINEDITFLNQRIKTDE